MSTETEMNCPAASSSVARGLKGADVRRLKNETYTAQFNAVYWRLLGRRYDLADRSLRVFTAVLASSTVAAWIVFSFVPGLWQTLSVLAAAATIWLSIFEVRSKAEACVELRGKWILISAQYDRLWARRARLSPAEMVGELDRLATEVDSMAQTEARLPESDALKERAYEEVLQSRGEKPKLPAGGESNEPFRQPTARRSRGQASPRPDSA